MEIVTTRLPMGSKLTIAIKTERAVNGKSCTMYFLGIGGQLSALKVSLSKASMSEMNAIKEGVMILLSTE